MADPRSRTVQQMRTWLRVNHPTVCRSGDREDVLGCVIALIEMTQKEKKLDAAVQAVNVAPAPEYKLLHPPKNPGWTAT